MKPLEAFLLARLDEEAQSIINRDRDLPIHYVGCYYYENTLDAGYHCDCVEYDSDSTRVLDVPLAQIQARRDVITCMVGPERDLLVAILAKPYARHPEYPKIA